MKNHKLILLSFLTLFLTNELYSQFSFSASPGINSANTRIGYHFNKKMVPYVGFQYLSVNNQYESSQEELDYYSGGITTYSYDNAQSINIFLLNVGTKYFFVQKNKISGYANLNFMMPFATGKEMEDGKTLSGDDSYVEERIKNTKAWGAGIGFGTEYFFDENFSLGAEFGLKYLSYKYEDSHDHFDYDYNTGQEVTLEHSWSEKIIVSPTYSRIYLSYYF